MLTIQLISSKEKTIKSTKVMESQNRITHNKEYLRKEKLELFKVTGRRIKMKKKAFHNLVQ